MTPQSSFMVLAAVNPTREAELRGLLASMNTAAGRVKPDNALIPFQRFDSLHVARLLIVDDRTVNDIGVYGIPPRPYPRYLSFLGDVDGDADARRRIRSCAIGRCQQTPPSWHSWKITTSQINSPPWEV